MLEALPNSNERQIWASVIAQAASDMRAGKDLQRAVIRWMMTPDFVTVCEYAGLEPAVAANYLKRGGTRRGLESFAA